MPETITILVVDDDAMALDAIASLVDRAEGMSVIGRGRSGEEAVKLACELRPDVVCIDMRMPGMDGVEATGLLRAGLAPPQVIALTSFDEDRYMFGALQAGAAGFILKDRARDDLIPAIRTALEGGALISPEHTVRLIERCRTVGEASVITEARRAFDQLTSREQQIAQLVATGASNQQIADELYISHSTVKSAISAIMLRLDAESRVSVAIIADRALRSD